VDTKFGVGLAGIAYWMRQAVFTDVMKTSHENWTPQRHTDFTWDTGFAVPLRDDGYPTELGRDQKVGVMMLRDLEQNGEDGVYVVRWDGDGVVDCGLNVVNWLRAPGKLECTVKLTTEFNNGLFVSIKLTNPADPVRNVRVFMPGFDQGVTLMPSGSPAPSAKGPWPAMPFHPHLLRFLQPFGSWTGCRPTPTPRRAGLSVRRPTRACSAGSGACPSST
jgi:hypothetical protein